MSQAERDDPDDSPSTPAQVLCTIHKEWPSSHLSPSSEFVSAPVLFSF